MLPLAAAHFAATRRLAILFALLTACGSTTRLDLSIESDPSLPIDHYLVVVEGRAATASVTPRLAVIVSDDIAGRDVTIEVWGLDDGRQVAYGAATARPSRGDSVDAAVTLAPVACGLFCEVGETACSRDGITTCRRDGNCLEWSEPALCPTTAPACSNGACAAECVDECQPGETRCDSAATQRTCGHYDGDSCLDWSEPTACTGAQTCSTDRCSETCTGASCMGPDAGVDALPDAAPDAPTCASTPCDILPQCGCDGGMACDYSVTIDALYCRPADAGATSTTRCDDSTHCAPGYTCAKYNGYGTCRPYCTSTADCGTRGLCVDPFDHSSVPNLCTSDCDPITQTGPTGCPADSKCSFAIFNGTANFACGARTENAPLHRDCSNAFDEPDDSRCAQGQQCVATSFGLECARVCRVGSPGTVCSSLGLSCFSLPNPFVLRGVEYGYCQ